MKDKIARHEIAELRQANDYVHEQFAAQLRTIRRSAQLTVQKCAQCGHCTMHEIHYDISDIYRMDGKGYFRENVKTEDYRTCLNCGTEWEKKEGWVKREKQ